VQAQKFEQFKFWETAKASDFLVHYAHSRGLALADDAAELLVQSLGTELRPLINELDKLELIAPAKRITRKEVMALCSHSENLFQVINRWILQQAPDQNYNDLHEVLFKRHPVELFALFQSYFNNIFRTCWLHHQRVPMQTIAEKTGQKPFKIKKDLEQFGRVPLDRWLKLKRLLVELEWKSKTGQVPGQLALEILLGA
jgi:DNA polymerase III delta subunit